MTAFSVSIFLGSFLLFIVQPLLAKKLLPWFGGSPSVWLGIVLFFQVGLLLGYLYAFFLTKIRQLRLQVLLHFLLLASSLIFIPLMPVDNLSSLPWWPPLVIFIILSVTTLLPVMLISSSSPLLQHWFCLTHKTDFPYRMYALSNLGSLLGLLLFPLLLEPWLGLNQLLLGWSTLYLVYFLCSGLCLWITLKKGDYFYLSTEKHSANLPAPLLHGLWVILAALSCALLLTTTQLMMQNVVSFPLLWLIPLTLYLLSFIITFSYPKIYVRPLWICLYAIMAGVILYVPSHHTLSLGYQIAVFSLLLFSGCMICHGELFESKPVKQYLTIYYLMIACGGVIGGLLVNLIAPLIFNDWWDFYLVLMGIFFTAGFLTLFKREQIISAKLRLLQGGWGLCFFALSILLYQHLARVEEDVIVKQRNFLGKIEIVERNPTNEFFQRLLRNGSIIHGHQFLAANQDLISTTYFSQESGIGLAMAFAHQNNPHRNLNIGVIGLGTGTIAALAKAGDRMRFYEIDPDMEKIARHYFKYLEYSPAKIDVIIGDGRIALSQEIKSLGSQQFDVLAIDAFNGDAIPSHLLTTEAMATYLAHLAPNGIIAFHVSSRYVDLYPPLQALANSLELHSYIARNVADSKNWIFASEWILISRRPEIGLYLLQKGALTFNEKRMVKPWTDDHNCILSVVRW